MGFPSDLSDVVVFKIHPAIGIARVSKSDDHFVFGSSPGTYKANGLMRRQAVQFRIFAYGENHVGLGELTPPVMTALGISAVWSAKVSNRKIAFCEGRPLSNMDSVITAEAVSNDANQGRLSGSLPSFHEGASIPLGQITATGLFIPPKAAAYRRNAGEKIPDYPNHTPNVADNTCDGSINVKLSGGGAQRPPVLPACILVAPGDFSPDQDPVPTRRESLLVRLREDLHVPAGSSGTIHNQTAQRIDEMALTPATGDFKPGFEVSFGGRGEVPDLTRLFYSGASDPLIDPREMRIRYKSAPTDPGFGAVRGQLTSGLCSPWQLDFTACVGYWSENLPETAFLDEATQVEVSVYRKKYSDEVVFGEDKVLTHGDDFERHQDKVGVVRIVNGRPIEMERGPGEDIVDPSA